MADDDEGVQSRALPEIRAAPTTPEGRHRSSYETGESSGTSPMPRSIGTRDSDTLNPESSPADQSFPSNEQAKGVSRRRRRHASRGSGGFLLHGALSGDREPATKRYTRSLLRQKGKEPHLTPENPRASQSQSRPPQLDSGLDFLADTTPSTTQPSDGHANQTQNGRAIGETGSPLATSHQSQPSLDPAAAQIVSMAINLNESRRKASRRSSQRPPKPPRLAPLPDSASRSNLRQHFQQQRKNSRTGSPRSNHSPSPRIPSSFRGSSPLQPSHDAGQEGQFQYEFSASTLSRAQKAKEHLELMAEYRRLLESLPPLKHGQEKHLAASPPGSPGNGLLGTMYGNNGGVVALGRQYNPLQYIRNRKVRSRERKVIDGEQLGFADVEGVRAWVDRVTEWNRSGGADGTRVDSMMPPFPGVVEQNGQPSPETAPKNSARSRRPRVDWFFDPCDVIADAYWLEQDHHKLLIEDRFWRKIFHATPDISRPTSRQVEGQSSLGVIPAATRAGEPREDTLRAQDILPDRVDDGAPGTRDRAKQKLHEMKGFHHRHNSSLHSHHDPFRARRESLSDASGSENDSRNDSRGIRRHGRRDTITSDTNALLKKQMGDLVAQEDRIKELENVPETDTEHIEPTRPKSPQQAQMSQAATPSHSRKTSVVDFSDSESKPNKGRRRWESPVPHHHGRASLDIPEEPRRDSAADGTRSAPDSPNLDDHRDNIINGYTGIDASVPSSRSASPSRNPLSKVKRRLREKSYDTGLESQSDMDDDPKQQPSILEPPPHLDKLVSRGTEESYKTHRSTGSMRMRDDQPAGLRGLFKSPRIDTVIRGGVSKLGDMLWRKDMNDTSSDTSSEEESEDENGIGQSRASLSLSRRESKRLRDDGSQKPKHFYDTLPEFRPIGDAQHNSLGPPGVSRPVSRQSSKWDHLKPPRIDVQSASPESSSPPPLVPAQSEVAEMPDSESQMIPAPDGVRLTGQRLSSIISNPSLEHRSRSDSRHWSITDRGSSSERTQLSKREIVRMRTLILSCGVKAMEINRRANEIRKPLSTGSLELARRDSRVGVDWADIANLTPDCKELHEQQVALCDIYPFAARALGMAIQISGQRWQSSADKFTAQTTPELQRRIWQLRSRITDDLSQMTRQAADEADETSKELALDQPLRVKHVGDVIEKLLRKRRRRFRWMRRALWLAVEWVLVGFMWYVWLVVVILRVFLGVGKGIWSGLRWLLWF